MRNVPKRINSVKTSYVLIYTTSLLLPKYGRLPPCNTVVLIENIAHFLLSDNIIFDFLSKGPASFSRLRESKRHAGVKGTPASAKLLIQLFLGELNRAFGYKKVGIISMIRTQKISCVHSLNVLY